MVLSELKLGPVVELIDELADFRFTIGYRFEKEIDSNGIFLLIDALIRHTKV